MFSRYTITAGPDDIAKRFSVVVPESYRPQFNAAPTHLLPVITHDSQQGLSFFYWGAPPSLANKKPLAEKIVNSSLALIGEKQVLKKKLREKRCLIPADGFFEWKKSGKRTQIPYRFTLKDKGIFSMAGLWEEYDDERGEMFHTFTVITCPSNDLVLPIDEIMPVILDPQSERLWLDSNEPGELLELLKVNAPPLDYYSVSPRVNSTDHNDRLVILPAPPSDQFGNLTLFD